MPFRSQQTLQRWVDEFRADRSDAGLVRVITQDGSDGADTGLILVPLLNATTSVFVEPAAPGDPSWRVTIEPQPDPTVLTSDQLQHLAAEFAVAAELCEFLEAKTRAHLASLGQANSPT